MHLRGSDGELLKVATGNLRHATSEEKVGAELVEPMLGDMAEAISRRRRQRAHRDLTGDPTMSADEEDEVGAEDRGPPPVSISRADTADPGTAVPYRSTANAISSLDSPGAGRRRG